MRPVRINRWMRKIRRGSWSGKRLFHAVLSITACLAGLFLLIFLLRFSWNVFSEKKEGGKSGKAVAQGEVSLSQELSQLEKDITLFLWKAWYPAASLNTEGADDGDLTGRVAGFLLKQVPYYREAADRARQTLPGEPDPAYRDYLESSRMLKEYECLVKDLEDSTLLTYAGSGPGGAFGSGWDGSTGSYGASGQDTSGYGAGSGGENGRGNAGGPGGQTAGSGSNSGSQAAEAGIISGNSISAGQGKIIAGAKLLSRGTVNSSGIRYVAQQLADYDFLMKHFYTVHPTAAAGRGLMKAGDFLEKDFSLAGSGQESDDPQILIYHTHSQEEFSDYHLGNKDATIVNVGNYLTELLTEKGYKVIHDTTVYDLRDGKLDRSRAYTYALDGVTAILQKYPSIQIVLDLHRDGVKEGTHLVTQVNGKPTASIMFFNGTSETPDGPIEYLKNPYRADNLAFSFQMKLCADACYPGFTRKIYIKGLRYNQHVRPASALIEVGAQTNTYEEARNAMEPLAELLDMVVRPEG